MAELDDDLVLAAFYRVSRQLSSVKDAPPILLDAPHVTNMMFPATEAAFPDDAREMAARAVDRLVSAKYVVLLKPTELVQVTDVGRAHLIEIGVITDAD